MLTSAMGIFFAFFLSWIVGHIWPAAQIPVFTILTVWWLWVGWRYASARDRGQF